MDPVLVQVGPLTIRWYGVLLAATIAVSMVAAYRYGPRFGIPAPVLDRTTVNFAIVALIGARVGYVLSHPAQFRNVLDIVRIDLGGLTSHGAIAAGLLYLVWASRRFRIPAWTFADAFAWAIPLGNVFVRVGNFINGELYGDPTTLPWGVRFPASPDLPRHPLQLYEALLAIVVLLYARRVAARRRFPGEVFWAIMLPTSVGRLLMDAMRSEARAVGALTLGQIPALLLIIWGVLALARRPRGAPSRTARTD